MADAEQIISIRVQGMSCGGCVARVQQVIGGVPGVHQAVVCLATHSAVVTGGRALRFDSIAEQLKNCGYDATELQADNAAVERREHEQALRRGRQALIQALMYALPVLVLEWLGPTLSSSRPGHEVWWRALQAVLCTLALVSPAGGPILYGGLRAVLFGTPNMDLLLLVGLSAAYTTSVVSIVVPSATHFHFHAVVMILSFINLGRYLETRARRQVAEAVGALAARLPRMVTRIVEGQPQEVPIEMVQRGDWLRVAPEQQVPVDGRVLVGRAEIDESMLTGEALPVLRAVGDAVAGGTLVVEGVVTLEATALGADSAAGRIQAAVRQAQASRTRMQRLADRVAGPFVIAVIVIAFITLVGWGLWAGTWSGGIAAGLAVAVIACPCAVGLATPTAVYIASARAALRGILVKDAAALERLGAVKTVVFDKTGTLTTGRPRVVRAHELSAGPGEPVWLRWAASVEYMSRHPLARAIVGYARERGVQPLEPQAFEAHAGRGVQGVVQGHAIRVGTRDFLEQAGVAPHNLAGQSFEHDGLTWVWVACDDTLVGALGLEDHVRDDASEALERLRELGLDLAMVSGDGSAAVRRVAGALGLQEFQACVGPTGKADYVQALRRSQRAPGFVGDGTNDAPALAAADSGIALATGTAVAGEASDICLVSDRLCRVADAVVLARRTRRIILQNLMWALGYNVVAIPMAACGVVPAWLAPGAMMFSSLAVVLNSLRLRHAI